VTHSVPFKKTKDLSIYKLRRSQLWLFCNFCDPSLNAGLLYQTQYFDVALSQLTFVSAEYLDEIEAIRRQVTLDRLDRKVTSARPTHGTPELLERKITPVLVHCSAGVGRTGVVILAEMMKASLERNQVSGAVLNGQCRS